MSPKIGRVTTSRSVGSPSSGNMFDTNRTPVCGEFLLHSTFSFIFFRHGYEAFIVTLKSINIAPKLFLHKHLT